MSASTEPKVPVEQVDPEAAERPSSGSEERPGFSLGGAKGEAEGELPEGGPAGDPALGTGRATGGSKLTNAEGVKG